MGREGDHETASGLSAEGQPPAAAAGAALHTAAGPGGWAGHKPHTLMPEHRRRIGRHDADGRNALPLQPCCDGAGLGGGIDHQAPRSRLPQGGLIGGGHGEVGVGPGRPQVPRGPGQLEQQGLIDAERISWIRPLIARDAVAEHDAGWQGGHLLDEGRRCGAKPAGAEPIPVEACAEAGLGIAALIAGQGAGGGAGEAAGAGDGDRPGFGIAAGEAEGSAMGLGWGHG